MVRVRGGGGGEGRMGVARFGRRWCGENGRGCGWGGAGGGVGALPRNGGESGGGGLRQEEAGGISCDGEHRITLSVRGHAERG